MSYIIRQVLGNLSGGNKSISVSITPTAPGNVFVLFGVGTTASASSFTSVAGNTINNLVGDTQITTSSQTVLSALMPTVKSAPDVITITSGGTFIQGLVAVEVSGVVNGAALASLITGSPTHSGSSSPYTFTSAATGTISAVPACCVGFAFNVTGGDLNGPGIGWTNDPITFQGTPPAANRAMIEDQELTSAGTVAATLLNTSPFDGIGIALVVLQETAILNGEQGQHFASPSTNCPF